MLHQELNDKRVNKINLRKEFFRTSIDELEQLVLKHYPSAEFKKQCWQNNIIRVNLWISP